MSGRTRCARRARGAGRTGADTRPAGRFGRNWGCKRGSYVNSLHFETCYYQAIEFAIERGHWRDLVFLAAKLAAYLGIIDSSN